MIGVLFLQLIALGAFIKALAIQGFTRKPAEDKIKQSIPFTVAGWVLLISSFVLRVL
jgi:hypothetical protein